MRKTKRSSEMDAVAAQAEGDQQFEAFGLSVASSAPRHDRQGKGRHAWGRIAR